MRVFRTIAVVAGTSAAAFAFLGCAPAEPDNSTDGRATATAAPSATASAAPSPSPSTPALRVADLMKRIGCADPKVIGTQLYSRETGRCQLGGGEVTLAVFDTDKQRDEWVKAGKPYGGSIVVGPGWAVHCDAPDAAATVADKLDGTPA